MKNDIEDIRDMLIQMNGLDISIFEDDFLEKSLDKRLAATGNKSYGAYSRYLKLNLPEIDLLLESLHIAFSEFFRNPLTFSVLEQIIIPAILEKKKTRKENEIRIWSAASAAGQEPYSIAMMMDEMQDSAKPNISCRIFATDINPSELVKANRGVYPIASVHKVSLKRINKYFTQSGENFIIANTLKAYIDYSVFDLLADHGESPPASIYGDFDLIFCSNMLFYYQPAYRIRILEKLSKNLVTGGFLITGEAERNIVKDCNFREVFTNSGIFQKNK